MYMNAFNQPRKPYAVFPPTADVAKSNFYMPGLMPSFSPTAYLEQYANAMQKGMLIELSIQIREVISLAMHSRGIRLFRV